MATAAESMLDRFPVLAGAIGGVVAWLVGFISTYLLVAPNIEESMLQELIETVEEDPATVEMVGWVFYNTHFVETRVRGIPVFGDGSTTFIGGENGFSVLLYLVPVVLLFATGLALGRSQGSVETVDGLIAGLSAVPAYFILSVIGVFLFEIQIGNLSAAPDLIPAVLLAGIIYPACFAGLGGLVAAITNERA